MAIITDIVIQNTEHGAFIFEVRCRVKAALSP